MSDERRLEVLRAIVQDYVRTSEPVGSKALLERHQLGVSAATVTVVATPSRASTNGSVPPFCALMTQFSRSTRGPPRRSSER